MKKLGFGMMRLPLKNALDRADVDVEMTAEMADYFIAKGFNYFDTAYIYHLGNSEAVFKKAVAERHPRETFVIADKMPVWLVKESADYQKFFDEQLGRCGLGYFDYYLLHNLGVDSYAETLKHGGFEFIKKLKAEGKARHIGFSFHDKAELLDKILTGQGGLDFVQLQINYIDWDNEGIQSRKCHEVAVKHGIPVIVMEPVKGGSLALVPGAAENLFKGYDGGASAASWAIRFAASLKNVIVVLSGMSTPAQMTDNTGYMRDFRPLNDDERAIIKQASDLINKNTAIPCTGCGYCLEGCPQKIAIPQYFSLYNNQKQFGLTASQTVYYTNLAAGGHGKASGCVGCGQCEEHCPQRIAVTELLKEVAGVFEKAG
ncbi:MAG: aldo/keto reductase [Spirochaetaceae bacterium]|nr:aldo/keto reductase [Spirochaetaceae bacterium]